MINKLDIGYRGRKGINFMEVEVFKPDHKENKVVKFTDVNNRENRITVDYKDLKAIVAMIGNND